MAGTLNTNGAVISGKTAFFENFDVIRYSATQPLAPVSLRVTSVGLLDLSAELNFTPVNIVAFSGGNSLVTGSGADTLTGGAGNDTLNGGAGIDVFRGGAGNDLYFVTNGDLFYENAGEGTDTVWCPVDLVLPVNFENVVMTGAAFAVTGNAGDNRITGTVLGNVISTLGGNDTLDGGAGSDTLYGGVGNDTYIVDGSDQVIEGVNEGTDTVYSSANFVLQDNIENAFLTGAGFSAQGNALANVLTGNGFANYLNGRGGRDTLVGGLGDDIYELYDTSIVNGVRAFDSIVENSNGGVDTIYLGSSAGLGAYTLAANVENGYVTGFSFALTGNTLGNNLAGSSGADTLNGGGGNDTLQGGRGDVLDGGTGVDTADFSDSAGLLQVRLNGGTTEFVIDQSSGTALATVRNIENVIGGSGQNIMIGDGLANVFTGNVQKDDFYGGAGRDTIDGGDGYDFADYSEKTASVVVTLSDTGFASVTVGGVVEDSIRGIENLNGGSGNDRLVGNADYNVLQGNEGNDYLAAVDFGDSLYGGSGDDTLRPDGPVGIYDGGSGIDTLDLSYLGASVALEVSTGRFTYGTGRFAATWSGIERFVLGNGNDLVSADFGTSVTLLGGAGDDQLFTGLFADSLEGGDGNDRLFGFFGDTVGDTLNGGSGDDYIRIVEFDGTVFNGGRGTDTLATTSVSLNALALNAAVGIERLASYSGAVIVVSGTSGNNTFDLSAITEFQRVQSINMLAGDDRYTGAIAAELVYAGIGNDTMNGGTGNDLLYGEGDSDTINGQAGNDYLSGGTGADTFLFNTALNASTNVDRIADFSAVDDTIRLDDAVFRGLAPGVLRAADFVIGGAAANTAQNIIYNAGTGELFYDADGFGGAAQVRFAVLDGKPALTVNDFLIV